MGHRVVNWGRAIRVALGAALFSTALATGLGMPPSAGTLMTIGLVLMALGDIS